MSRGFAAPVAPPVPAAEAKVAGLDVVLYAVSIFAWSTSWIALKMQTTAGVAAEVSVAWRFALAAVLMFALLAARRERLAFGPGDHLRFAGLGILLFSVNFYLFYLGGRFLTSGLLSVVFSLASIGNLLLAALVLKQKITPRVGLGAGVGFVGIALIFWPEIAATHLGGDALLGLGLCVAGTACFCTGNLVSGAAQRRGLPVLATNAWGMAYGAAAMALLALAKGDDFAIPLEPVYLGSLVWLAVISSVVAFFCYLTLLGRIGSARAGYVTVVIPVFALLISTVAESYHWTGPAILGLAAVIAGNVVVLTRR